MSAKIIYLSLTLINIKIGQCNYIETVTHKARLDRSNIVNKGVWVRNNLNDNIAEKAKVSDFIFGQSSIDADTLQQNNFDAFGTSYMQDSPVFSTYLDRQKRSGRDKLRKRLRKSINNKINPNEEYDITDLAKSKIINDIRPTSVFNDYPYQVAILLNNNKNGLDKTTLENVQENNTSTKNIDKVNDTNTKIFENEINSTNDTFKFVNGPKRSMKYDFETEIIKKIEFTEDLNKTEEVKDKENINDSKVNDRNVFDKEEWHQSAPIPDVNIYKVVPKEPMQKSKPVTERGLIKVISMLTKTFKKIMKQHTEIKEIQNKMNEINNEFTKKSDLFTPKFQDFDLKYLYVVKFNDKLKEFDAKMTAKDEYFKNKEKDLNRSLKEFENQQKKFLLQQKQFYNIQKLMLSQNEKINLKQNLIAKTQSEISHRQNNFARILKKAKQLYIDSRNPTITKLSSSIAKIKEPQKSFQSKIKHLTTARPESATDSVKINLFSIPIANKIQKDPDDLILKEKDEQAIDDLVYKYYFNNTFIDNFMKSKILNSFMANTENIGPTRNVKTKRNEFETTILLPVVEANETDIQTHNRKRRWINHHSKNKNKRRYRGKVALAHVINATDAKPINGNNENSIDIKVSANTPEIYPVTENSIKKDPFLVMATNFCNEIQQNGNQQMLRWCVEKALRKLRFLDVKVSQPTTESKTSTTIRNSVESQQILEHVNVVPLLNDKMNQNYQSESQNTMPNPTIRSITSKTIDVSPISITSPVLLTTDTIYTSVPRQTDAATDFLNFPDNAELESHLKEFDITPDTEGNVYYEGSVHESDLIIDSESQGVEDIMPEESNSRLQVDPLTFDLQAKRRALVRKLNERIKKSLG